MTDRKQLLNALELLPLDRQRAMVAEKELVRIARDEEGEYKVISLPVHKLSTSEIYMAFSTNGLRSPAEQIRLIERKNSCRSIKKRKNIQRTIKVDPDTKCIKIGGRYITKGNKRVKVYKNWSTVEVLWI